MIAGDASMLVMTVDFTWSTAIVASLRGYVSRGRSIGAQAFKKATGLQANRAGRHHGVELPRQAREVGTLADVVGAIVPDPEIEARLRERDVRADVRGRRQAFRIDDVPAEQPGDLAVGE